MNDNEQSQPANPTPSAPETPRSAPVMDVVRRPVEAPAQRSEIAPPPEVMEQIAPKEPTPSPVQDVTPPTPTEAPAPEPAPAVPDGPKEPPADDAASESGEAEKQVARDTATAQKAQKQPAPKPVRPPRQGSNVAAAIIATVVIILALAGLTVYAYLQSK